jgi:hypothetical protein
MQIVSRPAAKYLMLGKYSGDLSRPAMIPIGWIIIQDYLDPLINSGLGEDSGVFLGPLQYLQAG